MHVTQLMFCRTSKHIVKCSVMFPVAVAHSGHWGAGHHLRSGSVYHEAHRERWSPHHWDLSWVSITPQLFGTEQFLYNIFCQSVCNPLPRVTRQSYCKCHFLFRGAVNVLSQLLRCFLAISYIHLCVLSVVFDAVLASTNFFSLSNLLSDASAS